MRYYPEYSEDSNEELIAVPPALPVAMWRESNQLHGTLADEQEVADNRNRGQSNRVGL